VNVTYRSKRLRTVGNWILGIQELYILEPWRDMYAMFQDDCLLLKNTRQYLERKKMPDKGYLNLYTTPCNQSLLPKTTDGYGWYQSRIIPSEKARPVKERGPDGGWQKGMGALALVFSRDALMVLLNHFSRLKPQNQSSGHRNLDGAVVSAMNNAGWREYVHNPSLAQHIGIKSTMQVQFVGVRESNSFMGEMYDALEFLNPLAGRRH